MAIDKWLAVFDVGFLNWMRFIAIKNKKTLHIEKNKPQWKTINEETLSRQIPIIPSKLDV